MATEKKKTKSQIKKEEAALKHSFTSRAYKTALMMIAEQTSDNRSTLKVRLSHSNYSRYIKFSAYGKSLNIQIFGDGNIVIELDEFCHSKHTEVLFEYVPDPKEQEKFLFHFENITAMLINEFTDCGVLDWHSYMDYVSHHKNVDAAYQKMMADYIGYEEGTAHESE